MKKLYFLLLLSVLLCVNNSNAQKSNGVYDWIQTKSKNAVTVSDLFTVENNNYVSSEEVKNATFFSLNNQVLKTILENNSDRLELVIPKRDGTKMYLSLAKTTVTTDDFKLKTSENIEVPYVQGLHYRGILKDTKYTIASISFFENEVHGLVCDDTGNYNIGQLEDNSGKYILYNDKDLNKANPFICDSTLDSDFENTLDYNNLRNTTSLVCRNVNLYWEADYQLYLKKSSSLTTTTNYITSVFAQMATLYANDNINILLAGSLVWTSTDPYPATSSTAALSAFKTQWNNNSNNFGANFAMLVAYETATSGNGGLAYLNPGYCVNDFSYGYSNISATFSTVPTYSWTVEVVTHETGHNLGSPHTHGCKWNGNNTAIDYCGPTYGSQYAEGSCPDVGVPDQITGGTIMSYCHLLSSVGINFNNGFGPQPKALIISKLNAASCITGDQTAYANYGKTITNNTVNFTNSSVGGTSYSWDFGDGEVSTATSPSHVYTAIGEYTVCLTATNSCGSTQFCRNLTISTLSNNEFSNEDSGFIIYPNPAKDIIKIKSAIQPDNWTVKIFDISGKLIETKSILDTETTIQVDKYASGVYLIQINTNERIINKKVVITRYN